MFLCAVNARNGVVSVSFLLPHGIRLYVTTGAGQGQA